MPLRNILQTYDWTFGEYYVLVEFDREANGEVIAVHPVDSEGYIDTRTDLTLSTSEYHAQWVEAVRDKRWDAGDY